MNRTADYVKPGGSQSDSQSGEDSDSSDAGPSRWKQPSSLEMDCVWPDEDQKEDDGLPETFTPESVE